MKNVFVVALALFILVIAGSASAGPSLLPMSTSVDPPQICLADLTSTPSLGSTTNAIDRAPTISSPTSEMQATSNGEAYCIVRCMAGYRCVPDANGGKCVPDPEPPGQEECPPCMVLCIEDTHVVQLGNCGCVCVPNSQ